MASYELKIDLLGGEKVESILQKLSGLSGALGSGGSIFGGGAGGASPISKLVSDVEKGKVGVHALAKEMKSATTAAAQGFKESGYGKSTVSFLKGLSDKMRENLFKDPANADLKAAWEKSLTGGATAAAETTAKTFKGVLWGSKSMLQGQFPATPSWLKIISMDEAFKSKSVGGGIAGISGGDAFSRFEKEHGNMFGSSLDWKLREMRRKSDEKFARQSKEEKGEMQGPDLHGTMRRLAAKMQHDSVTFKKDMSFLLMPLFNPGSMWATMFSARQTFSALNTAHGKAFSAASLGGMGAGAATAMLVGAATVVGLALKALAVTVKQTMAAYEQARQIYSKALQNGMGLQWSTKRGLLAQIMGVSEQDVFRFGAQMNYLNPKLEQAASILAKTATPLTQVSWEFKVLKVDMESMFALIADRATPTVLGFTSALDGLIKWLTSHTSYLNALVNGAASGASSAILGNASGPMGAIMKMFGLYGSIQLAKGAMPSPQAWMKQLPASHWEHMGLVIGGGAANYQKQISQNTASIARDMKVVAHHIMGIGKGPGNSVWGMSPFVAQP